MNKIIKSELLKYFSGKMIYICSGILMFLSVLDFIMTKVIGKLKPELLANMKVLSTQEYIMNSLIGLFSGGILFIIVTILVSSSISEDYGNGTMKYSLLAVSRVKLLIGKIITIGIINFIYIALSLLSSSIIGFITHKWSDNSYSLIQIAGAFFLCWITLFGFTCLIIFAVNKISKAGGAIGVGIGIYFFISIIGALIPEEYKGAIITANIYKLTDINVKSWGAIIITGLIYIIIFSTLSVFSFRKKEILS